MSTTHRHLINFTNFRFFFFFSLYFQFRLFLREFCIEILQSAYNNLIRQVRRVLERSTSGHDDSYLLWALRFFMEFNRLSEFKLDLIR